MEIYGDKGSRDYVAPVKAHVAAAENNLIKYHKSVKEFWGLLAADCCREVFY